MIAPNVARAGDLVLVPFPFSDLSARKRRPTLVVSMESYNISHPDLLVMPLTTNIRDAEHSVLVDPKDLTRGQLPRTSRIKADRITSLDQTIIQGIIGTVKPHIVEAAVRELLSVISVEE